MPNLLRLYHTLRHLRFRQVWYQVYYRLSGRLSTNWSEVSAISIAGGQVPALTPESCLAAAGMAHRLTPPAIFDFLNQPKDFSSVAQINWNYGGAGKLWTYNLNYFEYLRQPGLSRETGEELITAWMVKEANHRDGWEPYPTSLRMINWVQFYRQQGIQEIPADVLTSLYRQSIGLTRSLEYHLDGNHLLENAIALSFISRVLQDEKRRPVADRLLRRQLTEQYFADGGHFEGSVMYHLILLWRLLDLFSLLQKDDPLFPELRANLQRQLAWAAGICTADGRFPHFNDSTNGVAPDFSAVRRYAEILGFTVFPGNLTDSGYRYWSIGALDVWLDVARIGPDYIPGHAHADNLTFCLHVNGKPVIVDPSISTYEKTPRRSWERSTLAHNTVSVGGGNSSDVWGGFRVGRRSHTVLEQEQIGASITASHGGYAVRHQRTFTKTAKGLEVHDLCPGGTMRLHFDHLATPVLTGNEVSCSGLHIAWTAGEARLEPYEQAMGFNRVFSAKCLVIDFAEALTTTISLL